MRAKLKILIVDDDRNMAHTLADILDISGYEPTAVFSPGEAIRVFKENQVDCVLTDVRMPGMSGVDLFEAIHQIKPDVPVLLMTAYASDDQIQQGMAQGVMGLLTKPLEIAQLLSFLGMLANDHCIAIVDDDPAFCKTMAEILTKRGIIVKLIKDPGQVLEAITPEIQTVLLDMKLNGVEGQEVLAQIRRKYSDIPVVIITSYREEMAVAIEKALELDAFTCLYKPMDIPKLMQTLEAIFQSQLKKLLQDKPT